jgi:HAD superfamily hydrolase (TIGR01549 family)
MKKRLLIFDFDGTIVDTKAICHKILADELKVFGKSPKQVDKAIDLGLTLKKTLKYLGFSFLITWFLHRKLNKKMVKEAGKFKKCRDVDSIKGIKTEKIIVSNSPKTFIIPILENLKLKKYFKEVYGAEDFASKGGFIKEYIKGKKLKKENCYYIGDRVADIKVARKAGCKSVVISGKCAWNSKKEILKQKPDFIISNIKELKKIV